jgi:hypothetical protein
VAFQGDLKWPLKGKRQAFLFCKKETKNFCSFVAEPGTASRAGRKFISMVLPCVVNPGRESE